MTTPVVYNLGERNALPLAPSMTIRHSRESGNPLRQTLLQRQAIYRITPWGRNCQVADA